MPSGELPCTHRPEHDHGIGASAPRKAPPTMSSSDRPADPSGTPGDDPADRGEDDHVGHVLLHEQGRRGRDTPAPRAAPRMRSGSVASTASTANRRPSAMNGTARSSPFTSTAPYSGVTSRAPATTAVQTAARRPNTRREVEASSRIEAAAASAPSTRRAPRPPKKSAMLNSVISSGRGDRPSSCRRASFPAGVPLPCHDQESALVG